MCAVGAGEGGPDLLLRQGAGRYPPSQAGGHLSRTERDPPGRGEVPASAGGGGQAEGPNKHCHFLSQVPRERRGTELF